MERPEPRVLLATDGSEEAVRATRTALALADELGAELHVVHVGHLPPAFYESMGAVTLDRELEDRMRGRAEEEARTRLEEQVQSIAADGGKVAQAHARIGRPDAQIVGLAEELDADLIVVGSRCGARSWAASRPACSTTPTAPCSSCAASRTRSALPSSRIGPPAGPA